MSPFLVDHLHIDLLVRVALEGPSDANGPLPWIPLAWTHGTGTRVASDDNATEIGTMLIRENACSVLVVTRHASAAARLSDAENDDVYTYTASSPQATCVEALKALDCYEESSSQHDDWPRSSAATFVHALRSAITRLLPGYYEAPWQWSQVPLSEPADATNAHEWNGRFCTRCGIDRATRFAGEPCPGGNS